MTLVEMDFFPSNFMFQTPPPQQPHESDQHHHHHHHEVHTSRPQIIPSCSSQDYLGVASLLGKRSSMTFSGVDVFEEATHGDTDEFSDDGSQAGEKKRRLNMEQVKTLEKNFELGNKLEPERKLQLARALGMQPRQIAIWFQNRRARWKTKQLEKDYDVLKRQFDAVKAENEAHQAQNQKLQAQIMAIKNKEPTESINLNIVKETEGSSSNRSDENSSDDINLDISRTPLEIRPSSGLAQLFQNSSRPELQFQKTDQVAKEESLISNMLCSIDEQTAFWPWLEPQHFN